MTDPEIARIAGLAKDVRGFRLLGDQPSDGETLCAGCWDRSDYDTDTDHNIPEGQPVFFTLPHPEYGDCDAYCIKCVAEDAADWEIISAERLAEIRRHLEEQGGG